MHISKKYPLRHAAGIAYSFVGGSRQMNHVVSYNSTSEILYDRLKDIDFEMPDVVNILLEEYEVSQADAETDAIQWVEQMKDLGLIEE